MVYTTCSRDGDGRVWGGWHASGNRPGSLSVGARVRYSTALPHLLLFIIFPISHVYYICYFLLSMYGHQDNAGTLSHVIFC